MKYGIVAFPARHIQDLANTYRKRYDPHYAYVAPHMTLKDPFEADASHIEDVSKKIQEIAKKYAPLQIHASRISSFYPTTNAIYFRVEPTEQLTSLHKDLQDQLQIGQPKFVFVPHITIAQKLSDSEHDDIFGQLRMTGVDETDTIDHLHLMCQQEDGSWTTHETFTFTGEK